MQISSNDCSKDYFLWMIEKNTLFLLKDCKTDAISFPSKDHEKDSSRFHFHQKIVKKMQSVKECEMDEVSVKGIAKKTGFPSNDCKKSPWFLSNDYREMQILSKDRKTYMIFDKGSGDRYDFCQRIAKKIRILWKDRGKHMNFAKKVKKMGFPSNDQWEPAIFIKWLQRRLWFLSKDHETGAISVKIAERHKFH